MTKYIYLLIVSLAVLFISCNVYHDVQISKDKSVDFSQYKTYAWLPDVENTRESDYNNDFIRQKAHDYFVHCMVQRQLEPDTMNPQLLLRVEWLSHTREMELPPVRDLDDHYSAPTVYISKGKVSGKPFWGKGYPEMETVEYAHGGVRLTVIDRRTNKKVWEGIAQGNLYDPNIMYDDLHPVIHQMMKKFPIKIPK